MHKRSVKFHHHTEQETRFYQTLHRRVKACVAGRPSAGKANGFMIGKLLLFLCLYVVLYGGILSNRFAPAATFALVLLFGMTAAFIGFNIAHDAVHGALFKRPKWNRVFGYAFELTGISSYTWHLKHNLVHHNNPNVAHADFDIEAAPVLRLSPADRLLPFHRWQHIYAPFAYMLFSLSLVFYNDIAVLVKTKRETIDGKKHPQRAIIMVVLSKLLYLFFMLALPLLVLPYTWVQVTLAFVAMHLLLSLVLALVLMPAHVFEATRYPVRNEAGRIDGHWAVHQMHTTIDYARQSRLCNFFLGGFNINVAHHLFPKICHVHLIAVAAIIKQTAAEYGIPYHETSLWGAIRSHFITLRQLGRQKDFAPVLPAKSAVS